MPALLTSAQKAELNRAVWGFAAANGNQSFADWLETQVLQAINFTATGITAPAYDVDAAAEGGGFLSYDEDASSGLDFAYRAGLLHLGNSTLTVSAGSVSLSASSTNYVEVARDGTVSANTSSFTAGRWPLYTVTTGLSTINVGGVVNKRPRATLLGPSSVTGAMLATAGSTKELNVPIGTIATSAGATSFCVTVPSTIAAASRLTKATFVSKDGLATSNTNYVTFGLVNKQTGAGAQDLVDDAAAANSTKLTGGTALVAYAGRELTLVTLTGGSERDVTGGHTLELTVTVTGTLGGALTQCALLLEFAFAN